jgi:hypothetical protein
MRISKHLIVLIVLSLPNIILAEINKSFIHGIGVELGFGHNTLSWSAPFNIETPGGVAVDRMDMYITPTIRIDYKLDLSNKFFSQPFIGYNRFGGKGGDTNYSFDAIEFGIFTQYKYIHLSFGIGAKINHIINAQYHYSSYNDTRSDWFVKYSGNAGIKISYIIENICISVESWFGINNLSTGPICFAIVHENHYRFLIGYNL